MRVAAITRFSFAALKERKLRSILTILMVAIGISLITALNGLSGGINVFIMDQFDTLAPNVLTVTPVNPLVGLEPAGDEIQVGPGGAFGGDQSPRIFLTAFTVGAIQPITGVNDVIPSYFGSVRLVAAGRSQSAQIIGIDSHKLSLIIPTIKLAEGELVSPTDVTGAVLGFKVARPTGERRLL